MDCLLLGGAPSVGKSETIFRIAHTLITSYNFKVVAGKFPSVFKDFKIVLEGLNSKEEKVRIAINSATDTVKIIKEFKAFYDDNGSYDILISSIRDGGNWPREDFFTLMDLPNTRDTIIEIPLGKITRKSLKFQSSLGWHQKSLDKLIIHLLSLPPFNL